MQTYRVHLTDRPDPVDVDVKFIDMCVAESEAPRHGIPNDPSLTPMSLSLVWVWCALRRMGEGVGEFQHFRNNLLDDLETVRTDTPGDDTDAGAAVGVLGGADPTPPAGSTDSP
jgi:hypothetical protein